MVDYSRIIGEATMEVVNPSMMVSRLDLVVLDSRRLDENFIDSSRVCGILGYL